MSHKDRDDYFTKYLFKTGLQCPSRLYYHRRNFPQNNQSDPFIAHSMYNKEKLTQLFRLRHPEGVGIQCGSKIKAAEKTQELLLQDQATIFDVVIISQNRLAKYPVLIKKEDELSFFQVHTKAFNPEKHQLYNHYGQLFSKWKSYLLGMAYQYFVLQQSFSEYDILPHMVLPNKNAKSTIIEDFNSLNSSNIDYLYESNLLHVQDVLNEVENLIEGSLAKEYFEYSPFRDTLEKLTDIYFSDQQFPVEIGTKCKWCEFRLESDRVEGGAVSGFDRCWKQQVTDYNCDQVVFDLIGPGTKSLIDKGIYVQKDIAESEVDSFDTITKADNALTAKHRQSLQIMKAKGQKVPEEIIKPRLLQELQNWQYPLHFLDFEAGNYAVPIRNNRRPYHLALFQFSCHTLSADGTWEHHQWLDPLEGRYPNYALVEQLQNIPRILEGTIIQYSNFERYALKTVRKELRSEEQPPENQSAMLDWLDYVIEDSGSNAVEKNRVYLADISQLVKKYYYNFHMTNSLSIKDVLRAVMEVSPFLKKHYSQPYNSSNFDDMIWWQKSQSGSIKKPYDLLSSNEERGISRGTEAMVAYAWLRDGCYQKERRIKIRENLLKYCELDTLAMLMIYQHWNHIIKTKSASI